MVDVEQLIKLINYLYNKVRSTENISSSTAGVLKVNPFFKEDALEKNASSEKNRVNAYRYGFQDQEHDTETFRGGSVNYKYRMHRPDLGRFFSVDPLHRDYPWNSGYAFSENRLIDAVELEGLEKDLLFYSDPSLQKFRTDKSQAELKVAKAAFDRGKTYGLATGGAVIVLGAAILTPIPGDEALGISLLYKSLSAGFDVASQMAAGQDVDFVGPVMNFVPGNLLIREGVDAMIDVKADGSYRTPFFSSEGDNTKTLTETAIDFGVGMAAGKAASKLPKQIDEIPVGKVLKEGMTEGIENIGGQVIKNTVESDED